mmetsp:Transcript_42353/g.45980  ORF Transcript_42353/g.45980 Transcript_42353/m.45980 type:complete len:168 (+) Transcript_42353:313-816(+)
MTHRGLDRQPLGLIEVGIPQELQIVHRRGQGQDFDAVRDDSWRRFQQSLQLPSHPSIDARVGEVLEDVAGGVGVGRTIDHQRFPVGFADNDPAAHTTRFRDPDHLEDRGLRIRHVLQGPIAATNIEGTRGDYPVEVFGISGAKGNLHRRVRFCVCFGVFVATVTALR